MLQLCKIYGCANGTLGLNLSRAPWDPYPWVSDVQQNSSAQRAGIRKGDTLLELNGCDILGLKISELATSLREHWQSGVDYVTMVIWRNHDETNAEDEHEEEHGINQQSLQKFATCLQHIAQLLECPVCLEVIKPPGWQCCNGHVLCNTCRSRSDKCPVCRVPLGPRGRCLLSDKLFTLLAENFPCDGVRNHKRGGSGINNHSNNNDGSTKCSSEYHNHPKMALSFSSKPAETKELSKKIKYALQFVANEEHEAGFIDRFISETVGAPKVTAQNVLVNNNNKNNNSSSSSSNSNCDKQKQQNERQQEWVREHALKLRAAVKESKSTTAAAKFLNCVQHNDCNNKRNGNNNNNNNQTPKISNNALVKAKLKSTKEISQSTGQVEAAAEEEEDVLLDDEVTNLNNEIPTNMQQQQCQNYHCPTGNSCCIVQSFDCRKANALLEDATAIAMASSASSASSVSSTNKLSAEVKSSVKSTNDISLLCMATRNVVAGHSATIVHNKKTRKKSAATATAIPAPQQQITTAAVVAVQSASEQPLSIKDEWQLLEHLSFVHRLAVWHFYGTYGSRMHVQFIPKQTIACLNVRSTERTDDKLQRFFLAVMPYDETAQRQCAVFLWHETNSKLVQSAKLYETIISSSRTGIKWFGSAQPLTLSWPEVRQSGHFLLHHMPCNDALCDQFEIIIKMK